MCWELVGRRDEVVEYYSVTHGAGAPRDPPQ